MILQFPFALFLFFAGAPAHCQTAASEAQDWKPKIEWSGDLRYRIARAKEDIDDPRLRQQLRARLGVRADVNESTAAVIRLATATSAISANQDLGDASEPGMARRPFGLDYAYIDWKVPGGGKIWLGRTANPFFQPGKAQTLWDADLAFEGLAIKWELNSGSVTSFVNLGGFIVSENYTAPEDNVDTGIAGGDLGVVVKWPSDIAWTSHFGSYHFLNVKNHLISRVEKDAKIDVYSNNPNERFRGNTVYVNDPLLTADQRKYFFAYEFVILEFGTELKQKLGPFEYMVFAEALRNDKGGKYNNALEYGLSGRWSFLTLSFSHSRKERDSVLGSFTDSDMNGGGSDTEGFRVGVGFQIGKNAAIQVNQFKAERGIDSVKRKFEMTHLDFSAGF
jgi:hypothetical protein